MTSDDPKSDTNYRGIGTLNYGETLDYIEKSKKSFIRTTVYYLLDMILFCTLGFIFHPNWDSVHYMIFGTVIGALSMVYALAIWVFLDIKKKCDLRLGELE